MPHLFLIWVALRSARGGCPTEEACLAAGALSPVIDFETVPGAPRAQHIRRRACRLIHSRRKLVWQVATPAPAVAGVLTEPERGIDLTDQWCGVSTGCC